nr:MAG TPA: hypothetical protein [Caudoviricetes sp.]
MSLTDGSSLSVFRLSISSLVIPPSSKNLL